MRKHCIKYWNTGENRKEKVPAFEGLKSGGEDRKNKHSKEQHKFQMVLRTMRKVEQSDVIRCSRVSVRSWGANLVEAVRKCSLWTKDVNKEPTRS